MAIPDFQSFFIPVLHATADGKEHSSSEIREKLAATLNLSSDDLDQKLPSGTQTVFANRVTWSTVYLTKAGALKRPRRGIFQITDRGRQLLSQYPNRFTKQALSCIQSSSPSAKVSWKKVQSKKRRPTTYSFLRTQPGRRRRI